MSGSHWIMPRGIAKICYDAGWTDAHNLLIAVSVCIAESNGYADATHTNPDGSIDRGLWQINNKAHPTVSDKVAFDPWESTAYARKLYEKNGFKSWSAYNNGAYEGPRAMGYAFDGIANYLRVQFGYKVG